MSDRHHRIDYIELNAKDLAEAKRFYGEAFGWQFNDYGPGPAYCGIRRPGGSDPHDEMGGLSPSAEVRSGGPLVIVYSDELDETARAVRSAGGAIVKEPFEFPGGRRFHFTDPSGNELAVWSQR